MQETFMNKIVFTVAAVLLAASAFAHVAVAPQQSGAGASQVYKVRVHNDEKTAVTSVELDIPAGATVASVAPMATAKSTTAKTGDRITKITWQTDIAPGKYVELAFTSKNPASGQLQWIVREHFADGSSSEWSDKPGAEGKASVTKILALAPASTSK
jgi:uncharacterized protein YcnI